MNTYALGHFGVQSLLSLEDYACALFITTLNSQYLQGYI